VAKLRIALIILLSLIILIDRPITILADGTVTCTATGGSYGIGKDNSNNLVAAAAQFTGNAGNITQFTVTFNANTGSPTGTITWSITSDSSGSPGSVLATSAFTPVASSTNTITVSNGPWMLSSTAYWIVLISTSTQATNTFWNWKAQATDACANAKAANSTNNGSTWTVNATQDLQWAITTVFTAVPTATILPSSTPPNTPVPTATEKPNPTVVPDVDDPTATILPSSTPPNTPVPTATILPSNTPGVPTATEKPNPTVVPDVDDPTATEKPNPTGQPTSTPYIFVPVPTATEKPNPTGIPTSTPNNTPVNTPTEINTPVDTPTEINTPVDTPTAIAFLDTPTPANTPIDTPTEINTPVDTPTEFFDDDSAFGGPSATPTDTLTPTITDTPTETPTPSDTPTPTPNLYSILTLEPSGQAAGVYYVISTGEAAIFAVLGFIITQLLVLMFLALRRSRP